MQEGCAAAPAKACSLGRGQALCGELGYAQGGPAPPHPPLSHAFPAFCFAQRPTRIDRPGCRLTDDGARRLPVDGHTAAPGGRSCNMLSCTVVFLARCGVPCRDQSTQGGPAEAHSTARTCRRRRREAAAPKRKRKTCEKGPGGRTPGAREETKGRGSALIMTYWRAWLNQ